MPDRRRDALGAGTLGHGYHGGAGPATHRKAQIDPSNRFLAHPHRIEPGDVAESFRDFDRLMLSHVELRGRENVPHEERRANKDLLDLKK